MLGSGEQVARLVHDRTRAQKLARHRLKRLPHEPSCHNVVRRDALGADMAEDMILSVGVMEVATDTAKSAERSAVRPSIFVPRRPCARMPAQADIGARPRAPPPAAWPPPEWRGRCVRIAGRVDAAGRGSWGQREGNGGRSFAAVLGRAQRVRWHSAASPARACVSPSSLLRPIDPPARVRRSWGI